MTASQALELYKWLNKDKIKASDVFTVDAIIERAGRGISPDSTEARLLNEVYRYTNGGGERQDQPFKAYRRPTSWGVK